MSYNYMLGYWTMEESEKISLMCDIKYSQEEFEELVCMVAVDIIKKKQKSENCYIKTFEDICSDIVQELIRCYGFKHFNVDASFRPFGWASIFNNEDWKNCRDEHLQKLTKTINDAGFKEDIDTYGD